MINTEIRLLNKILSVNFGGIGNVTWLITFLHCKLFNTGTKAQEDKIPIHRAIL
jgi:hypothetical protein